MEASAIPAPAPAVRRPAAPATGRFLRLRSDEQLVALFRAGDDAAFQAIHDRYRQRLFAYARQMLGGCRQDAEDAMQDVFLRAYGALRADSRPISLRAWLYRVAHNRCIDHLRRPVPPVAEVFELSRRPLHDPIEEAERREDLRRLVHDVRNLPEQQRSALLMREMDGLSYIELADALDVTVPAVKSLLVRARIGLVEAGEARNADCAEIRASIALAHGRGVRATGLARRHMRECEDCRGYRAQLKAVHAQMAALNPGAGLSPFAGLAQLLGLGGVGTSAAAGGGIAAIGTSAVGKVAVVMCCVAVTAGGASEVRQQISVDASRAQAALGAAPAPAAQRGVEAPAPAGAVRLVEPLAFSAVTRLADVAAPKAAAASRDEEREAAAAEQVEVVPQDDAISPHGDDVSASTPAALADGGAAGPAEDPEAATPTAAEPVLEKTPVEQTSSVQPQAAADLEAATADEEPTVEGTPGGAVAP